MTPDLLNQWQPGQAVLACAVIGGKVIKKPCTIARVTEQGALVVLDADPKRFQYFDADGRSGDGRNAAWLEARG